MTYRERRPLLGLCPDEPTPARSRRLHVRWQSAANRAIRAFVTRALISALVSFLIVTSSVAGFGSHARPVTEPVIRIAAAYATGHLREAWNGYLAVISSVEQEARDDLLHCVSGRKCPNVWHLATVVSVSRKEASSIASWCRSRRAYCDSLGVPDSLAPLVRNDRTPEDSTMLLAFRKGRSQHLLPPEAARSVLFGGATRLGPWLTLPRRITWPSLHVRESRSFMPVVHSPRRPCEPAGTS